MKNKVEVEANNKAGGAIKDCIGMVLADFCQEESKDVLWFSDAGEGAARITAERQRQIESEGWSAEHDDQWTGDELLEAAECYIHVSRNSSGYEVQYDAYDINWPWDTEWFKPCPEGSDQVGRIRCLEKAGALIAAEIDRLNRLTPHI